MAISKGPYGGMEIPGHAVGQQWELVNALGSRLSLELDCTVRWPGFDKNAFTCYHGYTVAVFRLQGKDDWSEFIAEHKTFVGGH